MGKNAIKSMETEIFLFTLRSSSPEVEVLILKYARGRESSLQKFKVNIFAHLQFQERVKKLVATNGQLGSLFFLAQLQTARYGSQGPESDRGPRRRTPSGQSGIVLVEL